jgi:hypothetical protein
MARIVAFLLGLLLTCVTVASVVRTLTLPRGAPDTIAAAVFAAMRRLFNLRLHGQRSYKARDRVMAYYAPSSVLALAPVWLILIMLGYVGMFWGIGVPTWRMAFGDSGSSLLTLGSAPLTSMPQAALSFSEAALGLILVALLIAYLPTMYAAFARREAMVALLEVRAGTPPSAWEMLERYQRIHGLERLNEVWRAWEVWFADLEESHTSLAALAFFRSPQPDRSWITAAGAVLDAASLTASALDVPRDAQADLTIRAGYVALRGIADFFGIDYDESPRPTDSIGVTREEFDAVLDELANKGLPLKPDRAQAWRDFAGWRVNYDTVLRTLVSLTMAPYAPWSSDRPLPYRPKRVRQRRQL